MLFPGPFSTFLLYFLLISFCQSSEPISFRYFHFHFRSVHREASIPGKMHFRPWYHRHLLLAKKKRVTFQLAIIERTMHSIFRHFSQPISPQKKYSPFPQGLVMPHIAFPFSGNIHYRSTAPENLHKGYEPSLPKSSQGITLLYRGQSPYLDPPSTFPTVSQQSGIPPIAIKNPFPSFLPRKVHC